MNQDNDDTKPTWKLGGELRIPVGRVARFDADHPRPRPASGAACTRSARGCRSRGGTSTPSPGWSCTGRRRSQRRTPRSCTSRRRRGSAPPTSTRGQRGGVAFGLEAYAFDDPVAQNRISVELGARTEAHFEGRDYSELWEVFAFAGDANGAASGPLVLDGDPTAPGIQARSHPGVSNIENYLELASRAAIRAQLGKYVRFAATLDLIWKTDHVISFADAGVDLPTAAAAASPARGDRDQRRREPGHARGQPAPRAADRSGRPPVPLRGQLRPRLRPAGPGPVLGAAAWNRWTPTSRASCARAAGGRRASAAPRCRTCPRARGRDPPAPARAEHADRHGADGEPVPAPRAELHVGVR